MDNRIYRSRESKMLAGVCGGIADMFDMDPTLVRLITVALVLFSGFTFLLVYILCAIIIPLEPEPGYLLNRHRQASEASWSAPKAPRSEAQAPEESGAAPTPVRNETQESQEAVFPAAEQNAVQQEGEGHQEDSMASDETVVISEADRYQ